MKIHAKFRPFENGNTKGFVDVLVNGSIGFKNATLMQGSEGLFVSMPSIKVGEEYRDVITGVSKEFQALVLEATLAAKESEEHSASVGEVIKDAQLFYEPHAVAIESDSKCKALASLTVKEGKDAEKSAFTINSIGMMEGKNQMLFATMPSVETGNPEFPYDQLCYVTKSNKNFVDGLLVRAAKDALEHKHEKKPSLDQQVEGAAKDAAKPSKNTSSKNKKQEKEAEK